MSFKSTTAAAASLVVKDEPGDLYSIRGYNAGSAQFIQVLNAASLPADTAVPKIVAAVGATSNFEIKFDVPVHFSTGIVISNSSTYATKTIGSANCWIEAVYI